ncbi:MAG TPA: peroxiredoxin [Rhodocyclaceae bacterium]|nr:peroxiredoxin [Rhodocyclaceae bacterium]HMZ84196.1 peroxiredoxin [Rhodocyclaceae bacterium]HNA02580.1 peroxiredoxin [Rhodocyclaceae bacterium]HNB77201.1 peroxiredoxin [Rhodocyclaceae bacterium]HNH11528.1 peroxiredoxin [Rhodocyclaceae bacterium]
MNKKLADFTLPSTGDKVFRLKDHAGSKLVIYFYPKDSTPGCTTQGQNFRDAHAAFRAAGCGIVGISRDSIKSHENFRAKQGFQFDLLSDTDETVCNLFGVIKMKNMYGKQVRGIERSTFVVDDKGVMRGEWRGVKVPGHVDEVLAFVQSL